MIQGYRVVLVQQVQNHKPKIFYRVDSKFHVSGWNSDRGKAIVFATLPEALGAIEQELSEDLKDRTVLPLQIGVEPVYGFTPPPATERK